MKPSSPQFLLFVAALGGALAVAFGAFGAHWLEQRLPAAALQTYDTASRYLMYHSLALLALTVLWLQRPELLGLGRAGWLMALGCAVFSASLYLLTLSAWHWPAWLTPLGGILMIAGWAQLAVVAMKSIR